MNKHFNERRGFSKREAPFVYFKAFPTYINVKIQRNDLPVRSLQRE